MIVCVSIVFPFANGVFLYTYKNRLEDTPLSRLTKKDNHLKHMFGSLSEEYKMENWKQYMHLSFFAARRLAFILILVFLREYPYIQLITF
jgi:hypothetical protein